MKQKTMKHLWTASLAFGLAMGSAQVTPVLLGQAPSQDPKAQQEQKSQTFTGKVVKSRSGQYALLTDEQAGKGMYLDDQDKAKEFEGKTVKVTGILDVAKNIVHVIGIEAA
jgi:hypothetical protein